MDRRVLKIGNFVQDAKNQGYAIRVGISEMHYTELFEPIKLTDEFFLSNEFKVQEFNGELGIVHTSSNLAAIYLCGDKVMVRSSQRSMDDEARERISEVLKFHFASFGADSEESSVYPGWNPCKDGGLIAIADEVWEKLYGKKFTISAIHAGLECGWFVRKNPALQLLSFGATECNAHTPQEKLNVASAARYCTWLRQMICTVGRKL